MSSPHLIRPDIAYRASFITAEREFEAEGRRPDWNFDVLETDFAEYVATQHARETDPLPGFVPETIFWLVQGELYIGKLGLRHHLNEHLLRFGGHIGYEIRPSERRKGYGRLICQLGLAEARRLGLRQALITCDDDNIGSYKIIEANGGVLHDKVDNNRHVLTRRYWVALD